jgi:holo-[acyl-carrier protein] synthase
MDLVDVIDIEESLARFGDAYLRRVFTPREQDACRADAHRLAACYAAKEATAKVLGAGDEPLDWRWIEVVPDSSGEATAELAGEAAALAERSGLDTFDVSMTVTGEYAAAVVLAAGEGDTRHTEGIE